MINTKGRHLCLRVFLWLLLGGFVAFCAWGLWFVHAYSGRTSKTPLAEYACEVEFNDYSWRLCREVSGLLCHSGGGRCLGVAKGELAGHNLDWLALDQVESIVRVNRSNKRQASIGVSSCNPFFSKSEIGSHLQFSNLLLPVMTVDGINESGVFICVNVAPKGEGHSDISQWEYGKQTTTGINPEAEETACDILLVRYMLDHATSACRADDPTSAWNLVTKVNWYASSAEFMNEEFHWLIADSDSSFVLEFIDNKPVMVKNESVISNFYAGVNGGYQPHGEGYERYHIVKERYDSIATVDDMKEALVAAWYGKAYRYSAADTLNFRYSDFQVPRPNGVPDAAFVAYCDSLRDAEMVVPDRDPDCERWLSRHTAVYNLRNRSLTICFDEDGKFIERKL